MPHTPILITGLSGSGISTALHALEDLGFYSMDHLPISWISHALTRSSWDPYRGLVLGIRINSEEEAQVLAKLIHDRETTMDSLFLRAEVSALWQRYRTSRRPHPIKAPEESLEEAMAREERYCLPLIHGAKETIDTTFLRPQDLADLLEQRYKTASFPTRRMRVDFLSLGFKYGMQTRLDGLYDVRFLKNPYFVEPLREKTGLDKDVQAFVKADPRFQKWLEHSLAFFQWIIPQYYQEGRHDVRIGIACTGGRHRSVVLVEHLVEHLRECSLWPHISICGEHRDISKEG